MEEVKQQILKFKDWDAIKKGRAINNLKGDNLLRFTGLPDNVLQAALEAELSAGGCIVPTHEAATLLSYGFCPLALCTSFRLYPYFWLEPHSIFGIPLWLHSRHLYVQALSSQQSLSCCH